MALKICEKCGESAEEAKAFCPACGNPFVVEQEREGSSEFDKYAGTVNVTQTAYNMMRAEVFGTPPQPEVPETVEKPVSNKPTDSPISSPKLVRKSSNFLVFFIVGVVILLIGVFATILILSYFF